MCFQSFGVNKNSIEMRRSQKQELLFAVCSKMGEVIPFFTDEECDACIDFLKKTYLAATESVQSLSSSAFQDLTLRELLTRKAELQNGPEASVEAKEKKLPIPKKSKKPPKIAASPRAPSARKVHKRALWVDDDVEEGDEDGNVEEKKKQIKVQKPQERKEFQRWDAEKHKIVLNVVAYDDRRDALVVNAKLSSHQRAKENRVYVYSADIDKIGKECWPNMEPYFVNHEIPPSFQASRFGTFCARKK